MLSRERETLLGERSRAGDVDARNELVEQNLGLAAAVAQRRRRRFPADVDDLRQEAVLGLLRAAETFDRTKGKFSTHGTWGARGRVSSLAADLLWRRERERYSADLADDEPVRGRLADDAPGPVELAERNEIRLWIAEAVDRLAPRLRGILIARYWRGLRLRDVGAELGVSRERVRQLEARALEQLRELLAT